MTQGTAISFVVWPDGKIDDRSLTVNGRRRARELFVWSYLPSEWFGTDSPSYVADTLWRGAELKGFRSYTIVIRTIMLENELGGPRLLVKRDTLDEAMLALRWLRRHRPSVDVRALVEDMARGPGRSPIVFLAAAE